MLSSLLELRLSHTRENNQQVNCSLWTADILNHLSYYLSERKHFPFWSPVFASLPSPGIFGCGPRWEQKSFDPLSLHTDPQGCERSEACRERWQFSANQGNLAVGAVCSKNSVECIGLSFVFVVSHKGHQELWEALKQSFRSFFIFILHLSVLEMCYVAFCCILTVILLAPCYIYCYSFRL